MPARLDSAWLPATLVLVSCSATNVSRPAQSPPTQMPRAAVDAPPEASPAPNKPAQAPAAGDTVDPTNPELHTIDLLTVEGFVGTEASILGLRLGQTWEEAKAIVDANPDLVFDLDEANPGRFYVNDAGGGPGDVALFYCQWPNNRKTMGRLVIYPRVRRFMPEGAARLMDMPSLAAAPPAVSAWLGQPDRSVVTLDVPSIGLELVTHVFEQRAIEIVDYTSSGEPPHTIFVLVVPELLEPARP